MNKGIENLFNKDLLKLMNEMLDDFILSDSSEDEIYEELRYANESIRVGLYLLSIEKGFIYLSQRLKNVNDRINVEVIELFKEAIDKANEKKF